LSQKQAHEQSQKPTKVLLHVGVEDALQRGKVAAQSGCRDPGPFGRLRCRGLPLSVARKAGAQSRCAMKSTRGWCKFCVMSCLSTRVPVWSPTWRAFSTGCSVAKPFYLPDAVFRQDGGIRCCARPDGHCLVEWCNRREPWDGGSSPRCAARLPPCPRVGTPLRSQGRETRNQLTWDPN